MPLPTKSRYTINEAAKFIANASGERVTASQVIDWGTQGLYGLYMLAYHCHVRYEDDSQISEISGSLVQVHPNVTQAATLESGYSMEIDSGIHDGRKFDFMEPGTSSAWRRERPASFNSTDLILLGAELAAFTASIAAPQQTATDTATPAPVVPDEIDFTMVATRKELIDAFGPFTGMDKTWFDNLNTSPKLKAARKYTGQGGRHNAEPLFCPYEVMQWMADPKRKKGKPLSDTTAWRLLKSHFPKVHNQYSIGDPNAD